MRGDHVTNLLIDQPWAITERAMEQILDIVQRPAADIESARASQPLSNSARSEKRGSVAVIPVEGPIFPKATLFTEISGATSLSRLTLDFQDALDDDEVQSILMVVNSPGGQVDGVNEAADMIRMANGKKPVTAYVSNLAASAAYWLASAAGTIVANESAFLGSIGVIAAVTDNREAQQRQGVKRHEIVSSQSPHKNADPATDAGRAQIQEQVDAIAEIFISRVAAFRGVTSQDVLDNFGGGKVYPAARAIKAGMADRIGPSFEGLVAELNVPPNPTLAVPLIPLSATDPLEEPMAEAPTITTAGGLPATTPPSAAVVASERQRIATIMRLPEAEGRRALAEHIAYERDWDVQTAQQVLAVAPKEAAPAAPAPTHPLANAMENVRNPKILPGEGAVGAADEIASEVAAVLQHVPQHRLAHNLRRVS